MPFAPAARWTTDGNLPIPSVPQSNGYDGSKRLTGFSKDLVLIRGRTRTATIRTTWTVGVIAAANVVSSNQPHDTPVKCCQFSCTDQTA